MNILTGCLSLAPTSLDYPCVDIEAPKISYAECRGNHVYKKRADTHLSSGDFFLASDTMAKPVFIPPRAEHIEAGMVGTVGHEREIDYVVRVLLAVNSEMNDMKLSDLMHSRLFTRIQGHYAACISQESPHSRFIFLARGIPIYFLAVTCDEGHFLLWSNEPDAEDRIRKKHGTRFYYYRLPVLSEGSLVLQTSYVCSKFNKWSQKFADRLKVFSALEMMIQKSIRH